MSLYENGSDPNQDVDSMMEDMIIDYEHDMDNFWLDRIYNAKKQRDEKNGQN